MPSPTRRFYITTPIYYVNDTPHLGTAYTTLISDIFNRYHKLFGKETFFLTGLDEHGQKCQQAALAKGCLPQEHCDQMSRSYQSVWKALNIRYDLFFRTSSPSHKALVQKALMQLKNQGDIYEGLYKGWYSPSEEIFYQEKELIEGKSPAGREVIPLEEKNYFFKMSKYQNALQKHLEENRFFIFPSFRQNELKGFLKKPLQDLCISRPKKRVSWGVEIPFDSDYVAYVWVDALLNYITAIGYGEKEKEFQKWWFDTGAVHFIGKDILTTHGIYWPCLLMALKLPLPKTILAHGWLLNKEQEKMSKSKGLKIEPLELARHLGVDGLRYALARDIPLGKDAALSTALMEQRLNQDLAHSLGNILNRLLHLLKQQFEGYVPAPKAATDLKDSNSAAREELQKKLQHKTIELTQDFEDLIENFQLSEALIRIQDVLKHLNIYLEKTAPWKLARTNKPAAGVVIYTSLEALRIVSILLSPVMPEKINLLLSTLKSSAKKENLKWGLLKEGEALSAPATPLFPQFHS